MIPCIDEETGTDCKSDLLRVTQELREGAEMSYPGLADPKR